MPAGGILPAFFAMAWIGEVSFHLGWGRRLFGGQLFELFLGQGLAIADILDHRFLGVLDRYPIPIDPIFISALVLNPVDHRDDPLLVGRTFTFKPGQPDFPFLYFLNVFGGVTGLASATWVHH